MKILLKIFPCIILLPFWCVGVICGLVVSSFKKGMYSVDIILKYLSDL